jgi:hypothetical protein
MSYKAIKALGMNNFDLSYFRLTGQETFEQTQHFPQNR